MPLTLPSFEPPAGIVIPTQRRLADVVSFSSGQLLRLSNHANQLLGDATQPEFKFALFTEEFIQLQILTTQALGLPAAVGAFEEKYGSFGSRDTVVKCVDGLKALSDHCQTFGNPAKLSADIQKLGTGNKPDMLYGQIVWLSHKIANTAQNFGLTLKNLRKMLGEIDDIEERYEALKELLEGRGGLIGEARKMQTETVKLRDDLVLFTNKMVQVKKPVTDYFSESGTLNQEAEKKLADIGARIKEAQAELSNAKDDYVKYCAAAAGSSVGLMLVSGGMAWPLAATAGGVLGALAEQARKRANEIESEIGRLNVENAKKARLVVDVKGLQSGVKPVDEHLKKVITGLESIGGAWTNVISQFTSIIEHSSPEVLKDLGDYTTASRIIVAQDKWAEIAKATFDFTGKAFVTVQTRAA